jgi:acyl-[acyl-carrier-protein]-phospholipid O-acyltransferase / long-chain-fatty-acid--[acyl-carrier-protein] ligase
MDIVHLKYGLFKTRRFLPIFLAQFLGAFNDNLLRSGLVVLITYAADYGITLPMDKPAVLVTFASALLVVPFILFSSLAGQVADRFEKAQLVTITKVAEIAIMCGAFYGFYTHNVVLLMVLLFVSGTHSTFFGPIKYSVLPEKVKDGELLAANGFISAGSNIGILLGMVAGALLVELPHNTIGYVAIGVAIAGFVSSLMIPRGHAVSPDTHIHYNLWKSTVEMVQFARSSKALFNSILGLSWFMVVGSVYMAQFPNYAKEIVHADNEVYTAFLAIFSIGTALGAVLADQLLKGEITAKLAPWALVGVSVFTLGMVLTTPYPDHHGLLNFTQFFGDIDHWPMVACMLLVAVSGGIYIVPLYAMMQTLSESSYRSRVIAASNLIDSLFMTIAAVVCVVLLKYDLRVTDLLLLLAAINLIVYLRARWLTTSAPRRIK